MAEVEFRDYLNEIDDLIEHGSLDQARQHCRHILMQYPKAVEVYRLLGKTLLEQEADQAAQDVFQRVLSVDPEDFVARVGLSIVHDRNNELEPAIWHMERAYEIAPSNALIQGELRRLYARRDGDSPERIPLTRGALARLYAQGDLNSEAIVDLRQLLAEQGDRLDLQVQLAEVLWRDEQRVEAAEFTQRITSVLPYCLKANLILGVILRDSGANGESGEPLLRAQAVDPENQYAQRLFGGVGPLPQTTIMVDHLELQTMDQLLEAPLPLAETEEVPEWLRGLSNLEQPLLAEPEAMPAEGQTPGLHMPDVTTEIPDWLQGLSGETSAAAEAEVPDWLAALTGVAAAEAISKHRRESEGAGVTPAEEVVPDWITQLGQTGTLTSEEEIPPVEEQPDWLAEMREAPPAPFSDQIPDEFDTETPDWLAQLQASESTLEAEPAREEAESLAETQETLPAPFSAQILVESDTETPDWLGQLQASESTAEAEPAGEEPDWLARLRAPHGEPEQEEESGLNLGAVAGLAGLAGAAAYAARDHDKGELESAAGPERPSDFESPAEQPLAEAAPSGVSGMAESQLQPEVTGELPGANEALASLTLETTSEAGELHAPTEVTTPAPPSAEVPEEMPSADDALAFLAKLAAGKEDELRAQAQQDAEVRMAEIMGRKPTAPTTPEPSTEGRTGPIKMTVPAATVAAVAAGLAAMKTSPEQPPAQVEPTAPLSAEIPEEIPSADDALAFHAKLAAGKEDQLRAQAEEDAEARMAEIMGRKPAVSTGREPVKEQKPGAGSAAAVGAAALAAGIAAGKPEEPAAEVPEEMPSADDALAFLTKLAAGKEDQLRAQAEEEAEARMAAIMGRSASLESTKPIEVTPTSETAIGPEAETPDWMVEEETTEVAEPLAEPALPDWLRAMRPTEEGAIETPESELPDWLRAMRPSEEPTQAGLAGLFEEEEEPLAEVSEEAEEELPATSIAGAAAALGLISNLRPEEGERLEEETSTEDWLAELAALEQAPAHPEVISTSEPQAAMTQPPMASSLLPDWWVQTAADTDEEPLKGLPEPYLSPRARAAEKEKAAAAAAVAAAGSKPAAPASSKAVEEQTAVRKLPQTGPLRQTGPLGPLPQTGPLGVTESGAVPAEVETLLSRVYQDRQDYAARLDLARTYWATGNREGAYSEYQELVTADQFTKETMADLETIVEIHDQSDWHRMLGDVYMKAGRLSNALEHYRRALNVV